MLIFHWFYKHFQDSKVDPGGIEEEPKTENVDFSLVLEAKTAVKKRRNNGDTTEVQRRNNGETTETYPAPRPTVVAFLLVFLLFSYVYL